MAFSAWGIQTACVRAGQHLFHSQMLMKNVALLSLDTSTISADKS